jgi:hypothetical protein
VSNDTTTAQHKIEPRWTLEPGRAIHDAGRYAFSIAANATGVGLAPWELDAMAHDLVDLLNRERP